MVDKRRQEAHSQVQQDQQNATAKCFNTAFFSEVVASLVPELPSSACICDGPALDLSGVKLDVVVTPEELASLSEETSRIHFWSKSVHLSTSLSVHFVGEVRTCFAENRDLALAAVQYSGSFLMHFPEDLLHDKAKPAPK